MPQNSKHYHLSFFLFHNYFSSSLLDLPFSYKCDDQKDNPRLKRVYLFTHFITSFCQNLFTLVPELWWKKGQIQVEASPINLQIHLLWKNYSQIKGSVKFLYTKWALPRNRTFHFWLTTFAYKRPLFSLAHIMHTKKAFCFGGSDGDGVNFHRKHLQSA